MEKLLISNIEKDRPDHPLVKRLVDSMLNPQANFISCTPDLRKHLDGALDRRRTRWTYDCVLDPVRNGTVAYRGSLRLVMRECAGFIGLIGGEMGDDVSDLRRSRFEVEYDCAFFRGLSIDLFILKSASDAQTTSRIDRIRSLQVYNSIQSHTLECEDDYELWAEFHQSIAQID